MKRLKRALPHLCVSLNLVLLVVVILDIYNPFAGLLKGTAFLVLIAACVISSVATAILLLLKEQNETD